MYILFFSLLYITSTLCAPVPITGCQQLLANTDYVIVQAIVGYDGTASTYCLEVTGNNINVNGQGFLIEASGNSGCGQTAIGSRSAYRNVTVTNVNLRGYHTGVAVCTESRVENVHIYHTSVSCVDSNAPLTGIELVECGFPGNNKVFSNTVEDTEVDGYQVRGISAFSSDNIISGNIIQGFKAMAPVGILVDSPRNLIENNIITEIHGSVMPCGSYDTISYKFKDVNAIQGTWRAYFSIISNNQISSMTSGAVPSNCNDVYCYNSKYVMAISLFNATGVTIRGNLIDNLKTGNTGDFTNKTIEACAPGRAMGIYLMAYSNNIGIDASAPTIITRNTISNIRGGSSGTYYSTWNVQRSYAGDAYGVYAMDYFVDITFNNITNIYGGNMGENMAQVIGSGSVNLAGGGGDATGIMLWTCYQKSVSYNTISNLRSGDGSKYNYGIVSPGGPIAAINFWEVRNNANETITGNIIRNLQAGTTYTTLTGNCKIADGYGWPSVYGIDGANVQTARIYNNSITITGTTRCGVYLEPIGVSRAYGVSQNYSTEPYFCFPANGKCCSYDFKTRNTSDKFVCESQGDCMTKSMCESLSPFCPPLQAEILPAGTLCRASANNCDAPEFCNGTSSACPPNQFEPNTKVCRDAAGPCDEPDTCSGFGYCNTDKKSTSQKECRAAVSSCDVAEYCDGNNNDCPTDKFGLATQLCREANGPCDMSEFCTGKSAYCPEDKFASNSTVCREAAGACDVQDKCTGVSNECPENVKSEGTVCRSREDMCDTEETCDGESKECPEDKVAALNTPCRPASGACDVQDFCTGITKVCPNYYAAKNTVCLAATDCSSQEKCTGLSSVCPSPVPYTGSPCTFNFTEPGVCATGECIVLPQGGPITSITITISIIGTVNAVTLKLIIVQITGITEITISIRGNKRSGTLVDIGMDVDVRAAAQIIQILRDVVTHPESPNNPFALAGITVDPSVFTYTGDIPTLPPTPSPTSAPTTTSQSTTSPTSPPTSTTSKSTTGQSTTAKPTLSPSTTGQTTTDDDVRGSASVIAPSVSVLLCLVAVLFA